MESLDKVYHFPIIIEQDEDGMYIVSCPRLPSCNADGRTIDEALTNIQAVIELALQDEDYKQDNQFIGFRELSFKRA